MDWRQINLWGILGLVLVVAAVVVAVVVGPVWGIFVGVLAIAVVGLARL